MFWESIFTQEIRNIIDIHHIYIQFIERCIIYRLIHLGANMGVSG